MAPGSAAEIGGNCDRYIEGATRLQRTLEQETGPATVAGTFRRYDELVYLLSAAGAEAALYYA